MNSARKLYDAARHYCIQRRAHWCAEYEELIEQGRGRCGRDYSNEAYDIFPRYHVLAAILTEIERIDAEALPEEAALRELIIMAGHVADNVFTKEPPSNIEAAAVAEERQIFENAIRNISPKDLQDVELLPYRRVLSPTEVVALWSSVKQRWGADGSYYFPEGERIDPSLRAFETEAFNDRFAPLEMRQILRSQGVDRVYELREFGDENYLMDVALWEPGYNGAEGYWFSEGLDWIMYCHHHGATTVGGTLAEAILAIWLDAKDYEWQWRPND